MKNVMDAGEIQDAAEFDHTMSKIEQFRRIVANFTAAEIDGEFIDTQSANAVVTVYDALNEANRAKFLTKSPAQMARIAWQLVNR